MLMANEYEFIHHLDKIMRRVLSELHKHIPRLDVEGIGPFGAMVIDGLSMVEPAPVQQLVQYMERDKSQMTRAIQLLESKELIERRKSEIDGRVDILSLTQKGRDFVEAVHEVMNQTVLKVLQPLTEDDHQQLLSVLRKLPGCQSPPNPGNQPP